MNAVIKVGGKQYYVTEGLPFFRTSPSTVASVR